MALEHSIGVYFFLWSCTANVHLSDLSLSIQTSGRVRCAPASLLRVAQYLTVIWIWYISNCPIGSCPLPSPFSSFPYLYFSLFFPLSPYLLSVLIPVSCSLSLSHLLSILLASSLMLFLSLLFSLSFYMWACLMNTEVRRPERRVVAWTTSSTRPPLPLCQPKCQRYSLLSCQ